jgi:hypothetical protein
MFSIRVGVTGLLLVLLSIAGKLGTNKNSFVPELIVPVEAADGEDYTRVDRLCLPFKGVHLTLVNSLQEHTDTGPAIDQEILQKWNGDLGVSALSRLPKAQRKLPTGYIGDTKTFRSVWQVFMSNVNPPDVDFSADLVVFVRNIQFYNSTSIARVRLKDGVLDVIAIETMSSLPIEDKVGFAMAVVSRKRVTSLRAGDKLLRITTAPKQESQLFRPDLLGARAHSTNGSLTTNARLAI